MRLADCVNRSPQSSVRVVHLRQKAALPSVRQMRRVDPLHRVPAERESLASASARGGRSARSPIETMAAIWPQRGTACGATARNWFSVPHSSASTCENEM